MNHDITLILIGSGIGLLCSLATILLQFFLSMKFDKIKRERDYILQQKENIRNNLQSGLKELELKNIIEKITIEGHNNEKFFSPADTSKFERQRLKINIKCTNIDDLIHQNKLDDAKIEIDSLKKQLISIENQLSEDPNFFQ